MLKIIKILVVLLATFAAASTVAVKAQNTSNVAQNSLPNLSVYSVKFLLSDPPSAVAEAELDLMDGRLLMIGGAIDDVPRGWAKFVRQLKITDTNGQVVEFEEFSDEKFKAQWRVKNFPQGRIHLTYQIDYSFAKTNWSAGNEQAAYYDGKALFAASRTAFIVSDLDVSAKVTFDLPTKSKLAVPWKATPDNRSFSASGRDLLENTLVVGDFGGVSVQKGNFEFTVALLGGVRKAEPLISNTLAKFANRYSSLFPETPPAKYLLTLFYAEAEDGESYNQSAAFTTQAPVNEQNLIIWGNTLGHELFHYWNSGLIRSEVYEESQWFQEGFTEYYANLTLIRERILPEKFLVWKMERILGKYLYFRTAPQFSKVSLKDSGQRKTTYRFGVYDGGWAIAFALDLTIREKTNGRKSLNDFMRRMYQKYGLTKLPYKYADLVATANEVAQTDLSNFFNKYIEGKQILPIAELLRKVGYDSAGQDYAAELYIYPGRVTQFKTRWLN